MALHDHPNPVTSQPVSSAPVHSAQTLTANGNLAHIQLGDKVYTLRITRAGKLILTK